VTTLANEMRQAGRHEVQWEGMNQQGQAVASGLYVYALETEQQRIVKRMNLVK
ncbi:MAG: FlgD immunoglobulin-like domain containing protein, partial [Bacteroidota bacterium]